MFLSFTLADLAAIENLANVADTVQPSAAYPLDIQSACRAVDAIVQRLRAEVAERERTMTHEELLHEDFRTVREVYPEAVSVIDSSNFNRMWIAKHMGGERISANHDNRFAAWADATRRVRQLGKPVPA